MPLFTALDKALSTEARKRYHPSVISSSGKGSAASSPVAGGHDIPDIQTTIGLAACESFVTIRRNGGRIPQLISRSYLGSQYSLATVNV